MKTSEVGELLERAVRRIELALRRRGALLTDATDEADEAAANDEERDAAEARLAASAVSGQVPPAGPQWLRGLSPLEPRALGFDPPAPEACILARHDRDAHDVLPHL